MKKSIKFCCIALLACVILSACAKSQDSSLSSSDSQNPQELPVIAVVTLMDHTSLNIIRDGIFEQLLEKGYTDSEYSNILFENAQGDPSNLSSIYTVVESADPDVVIAITTSAATAMAPLTQQGIPLVFAACSAPASAFNVASDEEIPSLGITGTSDLLNIEKILETASRLIHIEKIGFLYNSGEANSVEMIAQAKDYCQSVGIEFTEATATSVSEVQQAVQSLIDKDVDAIFSPTDNTVASAMDIVTQLTRQAKIPMITGADSMVSDGGFMTAGINYTQLAHETADLAIEILEGTPVEELAIRTFMDDLSIYVNIDAAEALGIAIDEEIKTDSNYVEVHDGFLD